MTNPDPKAGGWPVYGVLQSSEVNLIRVGINQSIDGVGGGTYSPSAKIIISGTNGLSIEGTGSGARLRYSPRTISRVMPDSAFRVSTNWAFDFDPAFYYWSTSTGATVINCDLQGIPNGSTLDSITVRYQGVTGGTVPATAPYIRAYKIEIATGTSTAIFAQVDDPTVAVSNAAYTAIHDIPKTSIAEVINRREYRYTLRIVSGTGGGFTSDRLFGVTVDCTLTDQTEWEP